MISDSSQTQDVVNPATPAIEPFLAESPHENARPARLPTVDDCTIQIEALRRENDQLKEAVSVRDSFLAVAAHELKNGMTPVLGRVDLLRHRAGGMSPEKIEAALDNIVWLVGLFAKRATTLLDVSRMTSGKLQVDRVNVDGTKIIEDVTDSFGPMAERAGSSLTLDLPTEPVNIMGDALSLEQVIDNLVSNAIKYGGGQAIVVSARAEPDGVGRFVVRDNGPGTSLENQARIFERFERAVRPGDHAAGFGIGLWVVKQLVDAMDGTIDVSSAPNAGATFCVTLPLYVTKEHE